MNKLVPHLSAGIFLCVREGHCSMLPTPQRGGWHPQANFVPVVWLGGGSGEACGAGSPQRDVWHHHRCMCWVPGNINV